jgi:hypothetical protein
MNARPREYNVTPDSEIGRLIKEAAASQQSIRVDTGEAIYHVAADAEQSARLPVPTDEEVAASIAGITQSAGTWKGLLDAEEFKAYIRERRKTANRSSVKQ